VFLLLLNLLVMFLLMLSLLALVLGSGDGVVKLTQDLLAGGI